MPNYLQQAYIHLYSVLIKFGWFDTRDNNLVFHDVINETNKFLTGSQPEQVIIGLQLLTQVVSVVNQPEGFRSMTRYRRVAANFRDEVLFEIFKVCAFLYYSSINNLNNLFRLELNPHKLLGIVLLNRDPPWTQQMLLELTL